MPAPDAPTLEWLRFQERMAALPDDPRCLPQAVVAAVNGPCVGGGFALCLAADIRLWPRRRRPSATAPSTSVSRVPKWA